MESDPSTLVGRQQPVPGGRSTSLDLLRAAAIFLVLGRHMKVCPEGTSEFFHRVTFIWNQGGWVGVDLFFVLSGFLISGLLFREHQKYGRIAVKRFLLRRGFKIYPGFYALVAFTVWRMWRWHEPIPWNAVLHEVCFVQNYGESLFTHSWSLAVEEHFYLLLPAVLWLSLRGRHDHENPFGWIPVAFALTALLCLSLRLHFAYVPYNHLYPTHLRLDSLFCGVALSYLYHYHHARFTALSLRYGLAAGAVGVALFIPAFVWPVDSTPFLYTYGLTLLYAGGALLLFSTTCREPALTGPVRALAFIGSRSYSIYLWHMVVGARIAPWPAYLMVKLGLLDNPENWYFATLCYLVGAVLFGIFMAAVIEYPVLRLRDRVVPSRSQAV